MPARLPRYTNLCADMGDVGCGGGGDQLLCTCASINAPSAGCHHLARNKSQVEVFSLRRLCCLSAAHEVCTCTWQNLPVAVGSVVAEAATLAAASFSNCITDDGLCACVQAVALRSVRDGAGVDRAASDRELMN